MLGQTLSLIAGLGALFIGYFFLGFARVLSGVALILSGALLMAGAIVSHRGRPRLGGLMAVVFSMVIMVATEGVGGLLTLLGLTGGILMLVGV